MQIGPHNEGNAQKCVLGISLFDISIFEDAKNATKAAFRNAAEQNAFVLSFYGGFFCGIPVKQLLLFAKVCVIDSAHEKQFLIVL